MHGGARDRVRASRVHRVRLHQELDACQGRQDEFKIFEFHSMLPLAHPAVHTLHHHLHCDCSGSGGRGVLLRAGLLHPPDHSHRDENAARVCRPEEGDREVFA